MSMLLLPVYDTDSFSIQLYAPLKSSLYLLLVTRAPLRTGEMARPA